MSATYETIRALRWQYTLTTTVPNAFAAVKVITDVWPTLPSTSVYSDTTEEDSSRVYAFYEKSATKFELVVVNYVTGAVEYTYAVDKPTFDHSTAVKILISYSEFLSQIAVNVLSAANKIYEYRFDRRPDFSIDTHK